MSKSPYEENRAREEGILSYGLQRRTDAVIGVLRRLSERPKRVLDMGCADGRMLYSIALILDDPNIEYIGVDKFEHGTPRIRQSNPNIHFKAVNLASDYPYPFLDETVDVIIAAAFIKHHPEPREFLSECIRLLHPNGMILVSDPRPFVTRVGALFGHFDMRWTPSLWSPRTIAGWLRECSNGKAKIESVTFYWQAPNRSLMFLERFIPKAIRSFLSLHQIVTIKKC